MNLTKEVIKQLRAVKRHILAEPRRFAMEFIRTPDSIAPCGTTCCIAGWLLKLAYPTAIPSARFDGTLWELPGGKAVGVDFAANMLRISDDLFYSHKWPMHLVNTYLSAETPKAKTMAGAKAIESFIKADGKW